MNLDEQRRKRPGNRDRIDQIKDEMNRQQVTPSVGSSLRDRIGVALFEALNAPLQSWKGHGPDWKGNLMNRFTCRHCGSESTETTPWWRITSPWPRCCGTDMRWNLFVRFDKDNRD